MVLQDPADQEIFVGVVSDTHGRLPPQVLDAFKRVSLIIHAGDLNTPQVLNQFRQANQLAVVRGNSDYHDQLRSLPLSEVVQVGGVFIYVLHDLLDLDLDPQAAGFDVVIHGHLHVPQIQLRQGVLYLNPGSPTLPRMGSRPGVALLRIANRAVRAELVEFIQPE